MENSIEGPQKVKNGTALWPSNSTSGNLSKETKNTNLKEYKHPRAHCSVIYNSQHVEADQVPINREMDKEVVHLYTVILLSHKKEWDFTIEDNMDGLTGYYAQWNKSETNTT